ncbi:MAG: CIA30 family protein [Victivallales bacterium]|nr:CIA30 family protein [Victivallales bacterium]
MTKLYILLLLGIQMVAFGELVFFDGAKLGTIVKQSPELAATGGFMGKLLHGEGGFDVSFQKDGAERRMIALRILSSTRLEEYRALDLTITAKMSAGQTARPCVMFVEANGGSWCRVGMPFQLDGQSQTVRLNLENIRQTAFSHNDSKGLDWAAIAEIYIGVVVEGAGEGTLVYHKMAMTNERLVPTRPLNISLPLAKRLSRSADKAVKYSIEDVEIDGERVLKETFMFPLGRHMYFTPAFQLPELDYAAYSGIRLTYKAMIPKPINGLLVTMAEGGGQFVAPSPTEANEWRTIDLKFKDFKMAGWAKKKDGNTKFDVGAVTSMSIGCHGTANEGSGQGEILIRKIELIP